MAEDKQLTCSDCGATFTFTADEQGLFKQRGYTNEPKRCPTCRAARKTQRGDTGTRSTGGFGAARQMHPAVCAQCGKATEVPFEPRGDRPVYCSDCYRKSKMGR